MQPAPPPTTQPTPVYVGPLAKLVLPLGVVDAARVNLEIANGGTIHVPAATGTSCVIDGTSLDFRPRRTWVEEVERDSEGQPIIDKSTGRPKTKIVARYYALSIAVQGDGPASRITLRNGADILCYGSIVQFSNLTVYFETGGNGSAIVNGRHPLAGGDSVGNPNHSVNGSTFNRVFFEGDPIPAANVGYGAEDLMFLNCKWTITNGMPAFSSDPADLVRFGATADRWGCTNSWLKFKDCMFAIYGNGECMIRIGGDTTDCDITGWIAASGQFKSVVDLIGHKRAYSRDNIPRSIYVDLIPEFSREPGEWEPNPDGTPSQIWRPVSVRTIGRARIGEVSFGPQSEWMKRYTK